MPLLDLLGRSGELRRIDRFLASSGSRRLRIIDPPGIGKSALFEVAAADATERGSRCFGRSATRRRAIDL